MEKEPCTKFCVVLISSQEVMKLQSFKSSMSDSRMYKTLYPWFCLHVFVNFMEKEPFTQFYGHFDLSHELMKLRSF